MAASSFLLVDAGNTRLKWTTAGIRGPFHPPGDVATDHVSAAWVRAFAQRFPRHQVVLASVVPKLVPLFRRAFAKRLHVVTGDSPTLGLLFDYPNPVELGADRLASAVAAAATSPFPVIVINCGTATAFTVLDAKGRLCGGAIAPGLRTQLSALIGATAQLPATDLKLPRRLPARSTWDAINAGVVMNHRGGVKEILQNLGAALPAKPRVILTGGDAPGLIKHLGQSATLRPLLVFEGLRIIALRAFIDVL